MEQAAYTGGDGGAENVPLPLFTERQSKVLCDACKDMMVIEAENGRFLAIHRGLSPDGQNLTVDVLGLVIDDARFRETGFAFLGVNSN